MYDVCLYGHITIDRIFDNFKESVTLGAVANSWDALIQIDPNLSIKVVPSSYGEAIILVDRERNFRLGRPIFNVKTNSSLIANKSNWHHIMYLNSIKDPSFISEIDTGVISADFTVGDKSVNLDYLKFIDFLFISDEDLFMDIGDLSKQTRGGVILHSPDGSVCTNGDVVFEHNVEVVKGLNVLGAGDIFASSFIYSSLQNNGDIKTNIKFAHKKTLQLLLNKNK